MYKREKLTCCSFPLLCKKMNRRHDQKIGMGVCGQRMKSLKRKCFLFSSQIIVFTSLIAFIKNMDLSSQNEIVFAKRKLVFGRGYLRSESKWNLWQKNSIVDASDRSERKTKPSFDQCSLSALLPHSTVALFTAQSF